LQHARGRRHHQERILVEWGKQNVAAGLKPLELQPFDDDAARLITLRSGRADVIVQPHAQLVFVAARDKDSNRSARSAPDGRCDPTLPWPLARKAAWRRR
jgi:ABC-type amino acid transport substrate-binding protein